MQLIMRHTGELFIVTPEAEHPLHKKLILSCGGGVDSALPALTEELLNCVLWYFDLYLDELVDYEYAPDQSKFALNMVRVKLMAELENTVSNGVTAALVGRGVHSFEIIDAT
jgi:hypothetical protein